MLPLKLAPKPKFALQNCFRYPVANIYHPGKTMKKRQLLTAVITLSSIFTINAAASDLPSKFYVAGAIGYADSGWDYANFNSTGIGINGTLGYHYSRFWSFEGGFTRLPKSTLSGFSINTNAVSAFAKMRLPIDMNKMSFYGKIGFGYLFNSGTSTDSNLALGMAYGVDYPIKPNLSLEAQYTHYVGRYKASPVPNADLYSVGINYRLPQKVFQ